MNFEITSGAIMNVPLSSQNWNYNSSASVIEDKYVQMQHVEASLTEYSVKVSSSLMHFKFNACNLACRPFLYSSFRPKALQWILEMWKLLKYFVPWVVLVVADVAGADVSADGHGLNGSEYILLYFCHVL